MNCTLLGANDTLPTCAPDDELVHVLLEAAQALAVRLAGGLGRSLALFLISETMALLPGESNGVVHGVVVAVGRVLGV